MPNRRNILKAGLAAVIGSAGLLIGGRTRAGSKLLRRVAGDDTDRFTSGRSKFDEAVGHFIDAAQYPYAHWQAMSRYEAGLSYEKLGQKQNALKQYQIVLDKHAKHAQADDAKKRIALLNKTN